MKCKSEAAEAGEKTEATAVGWMASAAERSAQGIKKTVARRPYRSYGQRAAGKRHIKLSQHRDAITARCFHNSNTSLMTSGRERPARAVAEAVNSSPPGPDRLPAEERCRPRSARPDRPPVEATCKQPSAPVNSKRPEERCRCTDSKAPNSNTDKDGSSRTRSRRLRPTER